MTSEEFVKSITPNAQPYERVGYLDSASWQICDYCSGYAIIIGEMAITKELAWESAKKFLTVMMVEKLSQ